MFLHGQAFLTTGDTVRIIQDLERVKRLQQGHGEWIDAMKQPAVRCFSLLRQWKTKLFLTTSYLLCSWDTLAWVVSPFTAGLYSCPSVDEHLLSFAFKLKISLQVDGAEFLVADVLPSGDVSVMSTTGIPALPPGAHWRFNQASLELVTSSSKHSSSGIL